MDTNRRSRIDPDAANAAGHHARTAAITVAALALLSGALLASLWLASFFLYASLRVNPLHAGLWGWPDALLAWHDGQMPNGAAGVWQVRRCWEHSSLWVALRWGCIRW